MSRPNHPDSCCWIAVAVITRLTLQTEWFIQQVPGGISKMLSSFSHLAHLVVIWNYVDFFHTLSHVCEHTHT